MYSTCTQQQRTSRFVTKTVAAPMLLGFRRSALAPVPPRLHLNTPRFVRGRIASLTLMLYDRATQTQDQEWRSLGTPVNQLLLHNTLPTGQSFRWKLTEPDVYTGVIGQRVVQLKQLPDDVQWRVLARGAGASAETDTAVLHDYFHLDADLAAFYSEWSTRDDRFKWIAPYLPGARMLRQDPVETLFQFICSSNNHISRIHGMVERLCSTYGAELLPSNISSSQSNNIPQRQRLQMFQAKTSMPQTPDRQQQQPAGSQPPSLNNAAVHEWAADAADVPFAAALAGSDLAGAVDAAVQLQQQQQWRVAQAPSTLAFYAFPTLQQLAAATEEALRADGFGYRAKFIVGSVQQLLSKPEGGEAWLLSLRDKSYAEAQAALCSLPGIGPKVAACISLFSLDKHDAIPVDTHVWDLATKYYAPHLAKKTLNKKLHDEVQQVFVTRFGPYAGWAHNTLFISELASHRHLLSPDLAADVPSKDGKQTKERKRPLGAADATAVSVRLQAVKALDKDAAVALVAAETGSAGSDRAADDATALEHIVAGDGRSRRTRRRDRRFV